MNPGERPDAELEREAEDVLEELSIRAEAEGVFEELEDRAEALALPSFSEAVLDVRAEPEIENELRDKPSTPYGKNLVPRADRGSPSLTTGSSGGSEPSLTTEAFSYHGASAEELRALPITSWEVVQRAGLGRKLTRAEFVVWKVRLAIERGIWEAAPVGRVELPDDAPEHVPEVYEGVVRRLEVQWLLRGPGAPAPYSETFAAGWCRLTAGEARGAIAWLLERGFLVVVKREKTRGFAGRRWTKFYALGTPRPEAGAS